MERDRIYKHIFIYIFFLCSGAYADVVAATDRITGDLVAVKMVTKTACKKYFDLMDKEVQIMSMVRGSPFLLGVREAFYSADQIFIVSGELQLSFLAPLLYQVPTEDASLGS